MVGSNDSRKTASWQQGPGGQCTSRYSLSEAAAAAAWRRDVFGAATCLQDPLSSCETQVPTVAPPITWPLSAPPNAAPQAKEYPAARRSQCYIMQNRHVQAEIRRDSYKSQACQCTHPAGVAVLHPTCLLPDCTPQFFCNRQWERSCGKRQTNPGKMRVSRPASQNTRQQLNFESTDLRQCQAVSCPPAATRSTGCFWRG